MYNNYRTTDFYDDFFLNFHVVAVMVLKLLTVHKYTYKAGYLLYSCKISMKYSKTSKLVDLLS